MAIREREAMSKGLGRYTAAFDYFDKVLIVLSAISGGVSNDSFGSVIGTLVGIASESFSFAFFIITGIIKKLLKTTQNKKKHMKFAMLATIKLNSVENFMFKALIDFEISHEEYTTIINEEEKHRRLKEEIRMMRSQRIDAGKIKRKDELTEERKRIGKIIR